MSMTAGKLASMIGIGTDTIRYYESMGLMPKPHHSDLGYRIYAEPAIARLQFIQKSKDLGFTLSEIKKILTLLDNPSTGCEDIRREAKSKISQIENKIKSLNDIKIALEKLTEKCAGKGAKSNCPIVDHLKNSES